MKEIGKRTYVSLDNLYYTVVEDFVKELSPHVKGFKINFSFLSGKNVDDVLKLFENTSLFLDLKIHDIPFTARNILRSCRQYNPDLVTVHASGGMKMMKESLLCAREEGYAPFEILAVTTLTSLTTIDFESMLGECGHNVDKSYLTSSLANLALESGIKNIVGSPNDVKMLKNIYGDRLKYYTPGIRLKYNKTTDENDHYETMTPHEALSSGSDYLIIGRPLSNSEGIKDAIEGWLKDFI